MWNIVVNDLKIIFCEFSIKVSDYILLMINTLTASDELWLVIDYGKRRACEA